jgi:transmembrane sensor
LEEPQKIEQLFKRYLQNRCSPEEIKLLFQYFDAEENESILKDLIRTELESSQDIDFDASPETKEKLEQIFQNMKKKIRKTK